MNYLKILLPARLLLPEFICLIYIYIYLFIIHHQVYVQQTESNKKQNGIDLQNNL